MVTLHMEFNTGEEMSFEEEDFDTALRAGVLKLFGQGQVSASEVLDATLELGGVSPKGKDWYKDSEWGKRGVFAWID